MLRTLRLLSGMGWLAIAIAATPASADDLELKRVLLSTGGVGYFEYEATVTGDATLSLRVGLDQVDDVLKSVVVYDDRGEVGTISLPGRTPLREVFRDLPFDQKALESPVSLLSSLRGAEIEIAGARAVSGRIVSVRPETAELADGQGTVTRHRLTLMTDQGFRQLILEDTDLIQFADPDLQAGVDRALAAIAEHGERDRRTLKVSVAGEGERLVRVAYLVEAPLWKASYRLTMPDDPLASQADLQGWAVVENLSGEDWNDVELTIVSGNPVTFRQALYDTYYVDREEVPVEVLGRVAPRADQGVIAQEAAKPARTAMRRKRATAAGAGLTAMSAVPAAPAMEVGALASPSDAARITAAESTEATSYVIFRHPRPVSVDNGFSLVVPIVAGEFEADRLALYQPDSHATHPFAAVRLENDGQVALPPGVITLYERGDTGEVAYVGDAVAKTIPVGEDRMLAYALDQKTTIAREERSDSRIATAKIAGGLLVLDQKRQIETLYRIKAPEREARKLVIEHPAIPGWDLVEADGSDVERTKNHYRITREIAAGESLTLKVVLERTERQDVSLSTLRPEQVRFYASSNVLSPEQRKAFEELGVRLRAIEDARAVVSRQETVLAELVADQDRLRENLRSVSARKRPFPAISEADDGR